MSELFRTWLLGVIAAAFAAALAQVMTPEGTTRRVTKLAGGLVLLLAMVRPLAAVDPDTLFPVSAEAWAAQGAEGVSAGEETMKILIARESQAYIVDKGRALGVECEVAVTVAVDGSGWPIPWAVRLTGTWSEEGRKALTALIADDLGIPEERQLWEG